MVDAVNDVERGLHQAEADRRTLADGLDRLDPGRIENELKAALREAVRSGRDEQTDPVVGSLRARHELAHGVRDQIDVLDRRIEATVIDLETLAARAAGIGRPEPTAGVHGERAMQRLRDDLDALEAAHAEVERLPHGGLR